VFRKITPLKKNEEEGQKTKKVKKVEETEIGEINARKEYRTAGVHIHRRIAEEGKIMINDTKDKISYF
jgi:hypothetical protein